MYVNCVYCGHRYGPKDETATSCEQMLFEHIAQCPQHPLRAAREGLFAAIGFLRVLAGRIGAVVEKHPEEHQISRTEVPEWIEYLSSLLGDQHKTKPPDLVLTMIAALEDEKERRVYYQDIVYTVCNKLDKMLGRKPGCGIVCGSLEMPSRQVQDALTLFEANAKHYWELQGMFPEMPTGDPILPGATVYQVHTMDEGQTWYVKPHEVNKIDGSNCTHFPYAGCIVQRCYPTEEDANAEAARRNAKKGEQ
jgi:hypothetical protein